MESIEEKLIVGAKIKIGKAYAEEHGFDEGEIITLVEGYFEHDNGLYTETHSCPAIWDEENGEFDSIYHLFGNDLEDFLDNEIID
jgi:hypothetical protein